MNKAPNKAAISVFAFGFYAVFAGLAFLIAPAFSLALIQLPAMPAGWGRVIGLMALVIGTYDLACGKAECMAFVRASVFTRLAFSVGTVLLVAVGQMPVSLLLIGAADAAGAIWTAIALRAKPA